MPLYEHVFIARQDISSAQVEAMVEGFSTLLQDNGGSVAKSEFWGLKTLAYRIKKNRKGHYVLLNIDAPVAAVQELERQQRLHEDILRYLTLRVDELDAEPSVVMQGKRDRDSRRGDREPRRDGPRGDGPRSDGPRADAPKPAAPAAAAEAPAADAPAAAPVPAAEGAE